MNDLIIKFKNSLNAFPKHLQEIRYFQSAFGEQHQAAATSCCCWQ